MSGDFLLQAFIYLTAAVIAVPIAARLGLGSVLGYLLAGVIIGPFGLGLLGEGGEDIMHFAEFGVVLMLFLVGLGLEPEKLWPLRKQILGVGMSQVLITATIIFIAGILLGLIWQSALAVALALSLSSTAIILQTLNEKGLMLCSIFDPSKSIRSPMTGKVLSPCSHAIIRMSHKNDNVKMNFILFISKYFD